MISREFMDKFVDYMCTRQIEGGDELDIEYYIDTNAPPEAKAAYEEYKQLKADMLAQGYIV
ncbi:MAG: hypothetical protein WC292_00625 [Clostridia bacterium]